jgi:hypothetical protein
MAPHLMAARTGAVEAKSKHTETLGNFAVAEP